MHGPSQLPWISSSRSKSSARTTTHSPAANSVLLHQRPQQRHVFHVFEHLLPLRSLEHLRDFAEARLAHDVAERIEADLPLADVLVPVHARIERRFRIVQMQGRQPVASDEMIKACEYPLDADRGGDVVAAGEEMRSIEADAEAL